MEEETGSEDKYGKGEGVKLDWKTYKCTYWKKNKENGIIPNELKGF